MTLSSNNSLLARVLVLAPTQRDADVTLGLLQEADIPCAIVADLPSLTREIQLGAGAALVTDDIFFSPGILDLLHLLHDQPSWSDFPTIMLIRGGSSTPVTAEALQSLRNVTLLERPAPMRSLVSAIQSAIRGRQRQYQIRDQIEEIQKNHREREFLLDSERAARTEAERANNIKDEFLTTVSHELRTPLNAILGWSQILARMPDDPQEVLTGVEIIVRNAKLQAQLIEDLLDMSRIISGKTRLNVTPIEFAPIVEAAVASILPSADAKNLRLEKNIDSTATVLGDSARLQQILWNLLSNAVKFTPYGGSISITLQNTESHVEFRLSDSGKGIPASFLPHIFERFRQADSSTTRNFGGLGLGLAIVKHLTELHGGTVTAESAGENCGTTFTLTLPLEDVGNQPFRRNHLNPALCDHHDLTGLRVLVVDDDPDARRLVKRLLSECKADVTTAASAREALDLLPSVHPTILISDIGMPEMDGYQFIQKVRITHPIPTLPAIAVTAFARSEDRRRALVAGYQNHLAKPVEPAELLAVVAILAHRTPAIS